MRIIQYILLVHLLTTALTIFLIEYQGAKKQNIVKSKFYTMLIIIPFVFAFMYWFIETFDKEHTKEKTEGNQIRDEHKDIGDPTG